MIKEESTARILDYFRKNSAPSISHCIQISSAEPGDHIVIVGGTHGNESAGVKAIVQLHRSFRNGNITLDRGKISFLLGNPEAFQKAVRYVDKDLNRAFGNPDRLSVEGNRALEIKSFIKDNNDIKSILDLHSVSIGDFKIVVYSIDNPENSLLALKLSSIPLHFAFHPEHMPGTLIEAASAHNIRGLIVECGNHYSAHGVETALQHIDSILCHHRLTNEGIMSPRVSPAAITRYESIQAIKPCGDFKFIIYDIKTGAKLSKGQKYARDDHGYHVAPQDCYLVVPSRIVKPTDFDAGFLGIRSVMELKRKPTR